MHTLMNVRPGITEQNTDNLPSVWLIKHSRRRAQDAARKKAEEEVARKQAEDAARRQAEDAARRRQVEEQENRIDRKSVV